MNFKSGFGALPLFWRIYIVCMILAAFRMGNPDWWEWPSAKRQSQHTTETSMQITPEHPIVPKK